MGSVGLPATAACALAGSFDLAHAGRGRPEGSLDNEPERGRRRPNRQSEPGLRDRGRRLPEPITPGDHPPPEGPRSAVPEALIS